MKKQIKLRVMENIGVIIFMSIATLYNAFITIDAIIKLPNINLLHVIVRGICLIVCLFLLVKLILISKSDNNDQKR